MPFKITFEGETFISDDFSLNEAVAVEDESGHKWVQFDLGCAKDCRAMLIVWLSRTREREVVLKIIDGLTLHDLVDMISRVDDDLPSSFEGGLPLAEDDPSTAGSAGPGTS